MSLKKLISIDKIEVLETGVIQVRQITRVIENDSQLSSSFHRWCIAPGEDYSNQEQKVQDVCAAVHTKEIIAAYKALLEASKSEGVK